MISTNDRTVTIGSTRLDYKKIIFKVIDFLNISINDFPAFLQNNALNNNDEKSLNGYLVSYFNLISEKDVLGIFKFYFDKDTKVEGSKHEPDIGVMLANQKNISKAFFHIECKRLPARDKLHEQEYVHGKLGGIQRFKEGWHGSDFSYSAMIGYIQNETFEYWFTQINSWISQLMINEPILWKEPDKLTPITINQYNRYLSNNSRRNKDGSIQLYHFWIPI